MGSEWNPWAELRRRRHLLFALEELPAGLDGVYWPFDGGAAILIDPRLTRQERRAVLAHELVHDEQGGGMPAAGMPAAWRAVVARDERRVDEEACRRLVPLYELELLVWRLIDLGEAVHATAVAEEFDVPLEVAQRALSLLERRAS